MIKNPTSSIALGSIGVALLLGACGTSSDGAGTSSQAGDSGAGAAGSAGATAGAAGMTAAAGSAGMTAAAGSAGTTATAGAAGSAGSAGMPGAAGSAGMTATAGAAGSAGMAGAAGSAGTSGAVPSAGCSKAQDAADSSATFVKKDLAVTGVPQSFIDAHPPTNAGGYTWTKRNYFLRLPMGYSPNKPVSIVMAGGGCGGGATTGQSGSYTVPPGATQAVALQVGLSYVPSNAVSGCATWANDFTDSPEPMYIKAIIDDIESKYCVDKNKVFINGYSSGAWEAIMAGECSNSDQVRAYGVQIGGGLRITHPTWVKKPTAAIYVVGSADMGNPIGPLTKPQNDSYGSALARDAQLANNGCQGTATAPWNSKYPKCVTYSGCPAKYPVVWCVLDVDHGNGPMPMGADGYPTNGSNLEKYRLQGVWDFYDSLPTP